MSFLIGKSAIKGAGQKKNSSEQAIRWKPSVIITITLLFPDFIMFGRPLSWSDGCPGWSLTAINKTWSSSERSPNPCTKNNLSLVHHSSSRPRRIQPTPSVCLSVAYVEKLHLRRKEACDGSWSVAWMLFFFFHAWIRGSLCTISRSITVMLEPEQRCRVKAIQKYK